MEDARDDKGCERTAILGAGAASRVRSPDFEDSSDDSEEGNDCLLRPVLRLRRQRCTVVVVIAVVFVAFVLVARGAVESPDLEDDAGGPIASSDSIAFRDVRVNLGGTHYVQGYNCSDAQSGALDTRGHTCASYDIRPDSCGKYDTLAFNAGRICCACGGGSNIVVTPAPACVEYISTLQFSPHAECYSRKFDPFGSCKRFVQSRTDSLLQGGPHHLDFANIIYSAGNYESPSAGWEHISVSCPLNGPPSGDDAMLLYNTMLWSKIGSPLSGCMGSERHGDEESRRPWIVQAFLHNHAPLKVVVVSAHYPHLAEYKQNIWKLKRDVQAIVRDLDIHNIILVADTNHYEDTRDRDLLHDIGVLDLPTVQATSLFNSCCKTADPHASSFTIVGYDRVIANFGSTMRSTFPIKKEDILRYGQRNMHMPVIGSLWLTASSPSSGDKCTTVDHGWENEEPEMTSGGGIEQDLSDLDA